MVNYIVNIVVKKKFKQMKNYIFYAGSEEQLEKQYKLYDDVLIGHSNRHINPEIALQMMMEEMIETFKLPNKQTFYDNLEIYENGVDYDI